MTEAAFVEQVVTSAVDSCTKENIADRRTIVYETRIDPAVVRVAAEKNKIGLFNKFLFKLNRPEEIEFVSIEKFYEPYIVASGRYSIDYYRRVAYAVRVRREVREVILFDRTFIPEQASTSRYRGIRLDGEERIIGERRAFLILDKDGRDTKLNALPSAPTEKNPQELIKAFNMQQIAPDADVEITRKRIAQRPYDVNRIVEEIFEIDERSVIYTPRFKITYKCPKIGKEDWMIFDGVTSKLIPRHENLASKMKRLFGAW